MLKLMTTPAVLVALIASASADTYHYACKSGETRYALTVNTDKGVVKMAEHGPPHAITTFKIMRVNVDGECAKYGWTLSDGATFCTATQGSGNLDWNGPALDCDQADTD